MNNKSQHIAIFSMFLSFGLILQAIEAIYLPSIPIPGVKLGIANLVTIFLLFYFKPLEILLFTLGRLVLASLIVGTFLGPAFYFSTGGALLSLFVILLLFRSLYPKISVIGLSLAGAAFHNLGQLTVAFYFVNTAAVYIQLPLLLAFLIPTGLVIGYAANYSLRQLVKIDSFDCMLAKQL